MFIMFIRLFSPFTFIVGPAGKAVLASKICSVLVISSQSISNFLVGICRAKQLKAVSVTKAKTSAKEEKEEGMSPVEPQSDNPVLTLSRSKKSRLEWWKIRKSHQTMHFGRVFFCEFTGDELFYAFSINNIDLFHMNAIYFLYGGNICTGYFFTFITLYWADLQFASSFGIFSYSDIPHNINFTVPKYGSTLQSCSKEWKANTKP